MFDVLVAGGGPAGAVTALCLARRGVRVAVVEATGYDTERFGETLPPEINPVLRDLGLWEAFQSLAPLASPGTVSVWGDSGVSEVDFVGNPHGCGWHLDRNGFDAMLLREAACAGAHVFLNRKMDAATRSDGVWKFDDILGAVLIDATGRNGLRLEAQGEREIDDVLLAITLLVSYAGPAPRDRRTYIETAPSGWWYSTLLPDGNSLAMLFTDRETYNIDGIALLDQLSEAPLTRSRLHAGRIEKSRVVYAPSSCRKTLFGEGWLAIGDSASCYDPLSGRGIFKALRQGASAAQAVAPGFDMDRSTNYARAVRQEFDIYVRQRRTYYADERRWETHGFWKRRRWIG